MQISAQDSNKSYQWLEAFPFKKIRKFGISELRKKVAEKDLIKMDKIMLGMAQAEISLPFSVPYDWRLSGESD